MSTKKDHEIILYDLACTKNVCFSPVVWRIRLRLNYKGIPYKTVFLEFPDIEPTLKQLGFQSPPGVKYTVPAIHHLPSDDRVMDSVHIIRFLEEVYSVPMVLPTSEHGRKIEEKLRQVGAMAFSFSVMPREINILTPRSSEYFRLTREKELGHPLEDLRDPVKEQERWDSAQGQQQIVGAMIQKNKEHGPFIDGQLPSDSDFFLAGALQSARVVHEETFHRCISDPGYRQIYEACLPFMEKKD